MRLDVGVRTLERSLVFRQPALLPPQGHRLRKPRLGGLRNVDVQRLGFSQQSFALTLFASTCAAAKRFVEAET